MPCEDEGRVWDDISTSQRMSMATSMTPKALGEAQNILVFKFLRRNQFWTSDFGLQDCEMMTVCYFCHPVYGTLFWQSRKTKMRS
jgi:hypothetical protein